jgi:hypothetical protein
LEWLSQISFSFEQSNYVSKLEEVKNIRSSAHEQCKVFAEGLQKLDETNFLDSFLKIRVETFNQFM